MLLDGFRVEDAQEILVEVEDRIAVPVGREHRGIDGVDGVEHDIEGRAEGGANLVQRQRPQRAAQQRLVRVGQPFVGAMVDLAAARLPGQQQPEDQRLREGGGKQRVRVARIVTAGLRAGEQGFVEVGLDPGHDLVQPLPALRGDRRARQPRRVRENPRGLPRVRRWDRLGRRQGPQDRLEPRMVERPDRPRGGGRVRVRVERRRRQDVRPRARFAPAVKLDRDEIAQRPYGQFAEPLELVPVVPGEAGRVEREVRLLQFDEGPRRGAGMGQGDVRAADAPEAVLRQDIRRRRRDLREDRLRQRLETGRQQEFEARPVAPGAGVRRPVGANGGREFDNRVGEWHRLVPRAGAASGLRVFRARSYRFPPPPSRWRPARPAGNIAPANPRGRKGQPP